MGRRIVSITLAFLLAGSILPARSATSSSVAPIGVVTEASGAGFNNSPASAGSSVYAGDRLSTTAAGSMKLRSGAAWLFLIGESGVTLEGSSASTQANLRTGTLSFSASKASAIAIQADEAFIRPAADVPTIAQVTILGPKELRITARRGALQFTYRDESDAIPEGVSYRVVLDPDQSDKPPQGQPVKRAGHQRKGFLFLLWGGAAWLTEYAVHEALESPDRP
jgi:hypothetical protein